ncbi:MAG: hypothetical protein ACTS27_10245 [Phycisphaerales bacterium]
MTSDTRELTSASGKPAEQYTIRRKVFKIFGAGFHIYHADGSLAGYCKQKAFRLREDLRIYKDEAQTQELLRIHTEQVLDFGATYQVLLPSGECIGAFRRRAMRSFIRDKWDAVGPQGEVIGTIDEDSTFKALMRRAHDLTAALFPQKFVLSDTGGRPVAIYRTHFNPFIHRIGVAILLDEDDQFDDLFLLAGGCLLAAIEGRQDG